MKAMAFMVILSLVLLSTAALADVPGLMNYQGTLTDVDGVALDTTVSMTFSIYTDSTGGSSLWTETQSSVVVDHGLFNVLLGRANAISDAVFNGASRWLGIQVESDPELVPRQRIASVGYAFRASESDTADYARSGLTGSDGDWTIVGSDMYAAVPGYVGIGTSSPTYKLDVRGSGPDDGVVFGIGNSDLTHRLMIYGGRQNDPNPFIHWKDGDPLRFTTDQGGWSEKMRITSDGNVGIGTTSPSEELEIYKDQNDWTNLILNNPNAGTNAGSALYFYEGGLLRGYLSAPGSGNTIAVSGPGSLHLSAYYGPLELSTGGGNPVRILPYGGNVGIGTRNPLKLLHLYGTDNPTVLVEAPDIATPELKLQRGSESYSMFMGSGNDLHFFKDGTKVTFTDGGWVGIGTSSPSKHLEVQGIGPRILVNATAGNPELNLQASGQTTWAIYHHTDVGDLRFFQAGDKVTIQNSTGNMGIGTSSPGGKLQVVGDGLKAGIFTTDYESYDSRALYAEFTATGNYDAVAIEGVCTPADYYGLGGRFEGGYIGVQGGVYASGSNTYEGVYGFAAYGTGTNMGVHGRAGDGEYNYGVYGSCDGGGTENYAGYFNGDVEVTGILTKGGGSFKIDHPLDPENKYLVHSSVESPDMMNVYNGNVILDAGGEAVVALPEWLETLNRDFRYQLTAIGEPGPNLHIAEEIAGNSFRIAGGTPGMKVSWLVSGIRQDPLANAQRIQVEVDKHEEERGKYLHPEAYGLSKERGLHYEQLQRAQQKSARYEQQRRVER